MHHAPFLWLRTVRHFPLASLWHRLRLKIGKRFYRPIPAPVELASQWDKKQESVASSSDFSGCGFEHWRFHTDETFRKQVQAQVQRLLENGQGELLNQPFALAKSSIAMQDELLGQTPLWRENYNYLAFLLPLVWQIESEFQNSSEKNSVIDDAKQLLEKQLNIFWDLPFRHRYWSTYGVSKRLLTYRDCLSIVSRLSSEVQQAFWENFYQDSCYLARFLEWDVQGNHLIQNLTAWLSATAVLQQLATTQKLASQWLAELYRLLPDVFSRQLLSDGIHFERTPAYHVWVLRDLLECMALLKTLPGSEAVLKVLHPLAERMRGAAENLFHASGQVALFGDASLPQCPDFSSLLKYAQDVGGLDTCNVTPLQAFEHYPQAGFAIFRNEQNTSSLIVDCGDFAARDLPAHAHCDLGSFELHGENGPIIVDAGVSEYVPSLLRDYFRGTVAHNTIWFPGEEQAEIWGGFRVAEYPRFQGCHVDVVSDAGIKSGNVDGDANKAAQVQLSVAYENYDRHYLHQRQITHYARRFWVVADSVKRFRPEDKPGWSLLHIHPDCPIEKQGDSFIVNKQLLVIPFGAKAMEWSDQAPWRGNLNLYSVGFNLAKPGQIIALSPDLERTSGWVLIPFQAQSLPQWQWNGDELILEFSENSERFSFRVNPAMMNQYVPSPAF